MKRKSENIFEEIRTVVEPRKMTSPKVVRDILDKYGLKPHKRWGQNFLFDINIVNTIMKAAELKTKDTVLEIGPGLGVLTEEIAGLAEKVVAIEIDKGLVKVLGNNFGSRNNVEIIQADVMKMDFTELVEKTGRPRKIIGNLPYYITSPLLMKVFAHFPGAEIMVFMVQKEVAKRLVAEPGSKDYGILSVAAQYYALIEIICTVPNTVFYPRPEVDSAVIKVMTPGRFFDIVNDEELFFKVVRGCFRQRRKTVLNSLTAEFADVYEKSFIYNLLMKSGIEPGLRAEEIEPEGFVKISNELRNMLKKEE